MHPYILYFKAMFSVLSCLKSLQEIHLLDIPSYFGMVPGTMTLLVVGYCPIFYPIFRPKESGFKVIALHGRKQRHKNLKLDFIIIEPVSETQLQLSGLFCNNFINFSIIK